ncbi:MAG: hypothetical protein OIF57_08705 [Marinobacterium sp.]|nr:hypothetical protein [Marinobacterium sp.]
MKAINAHLPLARLASADLQKTIEQSPTSFDVIIFPADGEKEVVAQQAHELDVVGSLESHERAFEYGDPVTARALEPAQEMVGWGLSSGEGVGFSEEGLKLLISVPVKKRSVVCFMTEQLDGSYSLQMLYLLSSTGIGGKTPIGYTHTLIPFMSSDLHLATDETSFADVISKITALLQEVPVPEPPSDLDENVLTMDSLSPLIE